MGTSNSTLQTNTHFEKAKSLRNQQQNEEAYNEMKKSFEYDLHDKNNTSHRLQLFTKILVDLNKQHELLSFTSKALHKHPNNINYLYYKGISLVRYHQQYSEAVLHFKRCIKLNPKHRGALLSLANALYEQHKYEECEPLLSSICTDYRDGKYHLKYAIVLKTLGRNQYTQQYKKCKKIYTNHLRCKKLMKFILFLIDVEEWTESDKYVKILCTMHGKTSVHFNKIAHKYYMNKQYKRAMNAFKIEMKLCAAKDFDVCVTNYLDSMQECLGDKRAKKECEKLLKKSQHLGPLFYNRYGCILFNSKLYDTATQMFEKATDLSNANHTQFGTILLCKESLLNINKSKQRIGHQGYKRKELAAECLKMKGAEKTF